MKKKYYSVILTAGEPAGIGPDILIKLAQKKWPVKLVACADPELLKSRAKKIGMNLDLYKLSSSDYNNHKGSLFIYPVFTNEKVEIGKLNKNNSFYVINTLKKACYGCMSGKFSAMITGPVHKGIINDAGINFIGHTEFLSKESNSKTVVMMFVKNQSRVAFATTHIPLKEVHKNITFESLINIIFVLNDELKYKFRIKSPKIYVCGLNPHSGECGYIGSEENNVIIPAIKKLQECGILVYGPFAADTVFQDKYFHKSDVILSMYHDQGLPVFKYKNFNYSTNITLGLPFIRTSVDHGVCLDIAGTANSREDSYEASLKLVIKILYNEKNF